MPETRKYIVFMCSHTHWDREWYGSFQEFRMRLVRLVDRLLDLLDADPTFRCFNLDGQTIVLEDYLEVEPRQRARLEKHIRAGRIAIGPWYILPDEWLVSGESTVRNLLRGRAICREFGVEPAPVGYLPDMFGHISQIPQLLAGFGIDNSIMWRGLSGAEWKHELWWESPDGTRIFAYHLPEAAGYINAAFFYHSLPVEARTLPEDTPPWQMINTNVEFTVGALRHVMDRVIRQSRTNVILLMNGVDHMEAQPTTPEIIRRANAKYNDIEMRHASFAEFMEAVKAAAPPDLQVIRGEQRSTAVVEESGEVVLPNILSSRIYLKLANARCQTMLERWAEPFSCAAAWTGLAYPEGLIHTAWKWLLRNHPHDSIGGCSVDAVHRQMETRFEWAGEIAACVTGRSLHAISENIDTGSLDEKDAALVVFNPFNWEVSDLVEVDLDLSVEEGWFKRNDFEINYANPFFTIRHLNITGWDGSPVKYHIVDTRFLVVHRPWMEPFGPTYQTARFRVALWAERVPPLGYRTYRISKALKRNRLPNRHGTAAPHIMRNEHLTVEVTPNGTLTVSGPALGGAVLRNLHYFEDDGDNGDGYTYSPPRFDAVVTSLGNGKAQITRLLDEPAVQAIAVDYTLDVPAAVTPDRQHRAPETVPLNVRSVFRLGAHSRRIDVETTVTNTAKDHRLRVCFEVPPSGDTHDAEMPFDAVTRSNRTVQPDERAWIEDMPLERAQQMFVTYGPLAIANHGLPEYEVVESPVAPVVKLTLLRAVNYLGAGPHPNTIIGGAGPMFETPEQQMLGRTLVFRYSIIPHAGDWRAAGVQREAHQHAALWHAMVTYRHGGALPAGSHGFLRVSGEGIVVSAVKQVEQTAGHYVVRFWNSGDAPAKACLSWCRVPAAVWMSNLAEEQGAPVGVGPDGECCIEVKPKQIVTLRFAM
jgi:mannosylglycerate hydrolase